MYWENCSSNPRAMSAKQNRAVLNVSYDSTLCRNPFRSYSTIDANGANFFFRQDAKPDIAYNPSALSSAL
jgi:hypothetical protein